MPRTRQMCPDYCQGQQSQGVTSVSPENEFRQWVAMDMSTGQLPVLYTSSSWRWPQDGPESPSTMPVDSFSFITWPGTLSSPSPQFSSLKFCTTFSFFDPLRQVLLTPFPWILETRIRFQAPDCFSVHLERGLMRPSGTRPRMLKSHSLWLQIWPGDWSLQRPNRSQVLWYPAYWSQSDTWWPKTLRKSNEECNLA